MTPMVATTVSERDEIAQLLAVVEDCLSNGRDLPPWVAAALGRFDYEAVKREWSRTLTNPTRPGCSPNDDRGAHPNAFGGLCHLPKRMMAH